jgi:SAM-dependent methyltransferase
MFNRLYERQKDKWDRLASTWTDAGPPASPSKGDVENFRTLLEEVIDPSNVLNAMILGCTPALRTMLAGLGTSIHLNVVCVDFSRAMYERTTELITYRNPQERFVLSDWLSVDITEHEFDFVLGDKVIDNTMPDDWPVLFERIHHHLRPHGYFLVRLAPQNLALNGISFSESLDKWAELYSQHNRTLEGVVSGLWEEILGASAFRGGRRHYTQKTERFDDEVEVIRTRIDLLDQYKREVFEEFIRVFWDSKGDEWSSYDYEQILNAMSTYFVHDKTLYSSDYEVASRQPIVRMSGL